LIDPKNNIRVQPSHSAKTESLIVGDAKTNRADSAVRSRAYELFVLRGKTDGRAEQDWYQAEADLKASGKKG
jgi:hypothetical protein